ncbi:hypothetical protein Lste_0771 [Legionella steelei]|uniref:Uncharacterized protein n=1 Tax=Legionella steelei TaxID=947033 RepID=A0A0W0ZM27_9GAMM|nr:hypothetical protein [Legionella steelei]KTD70167.1 hypothetical protein Lste_0771 [Legionella steelei]
MVLEKMSLQLVKTFKEHQDNLLYAPYSKCYGEYLLNLPNGMTMFDEELESFILFLPFLVNA